MSSKESPIPKRYDHAGGWDNEEGDLVWSMPKSETALLARRVLAIALPGMTSTLSPASVHIVAGPPGHRWVYSNFGYLMLGQLIERLERVI